MTHSNGMVCGFQGITLAGQRSPLYRLFVEYLGLEMREEIVHPRITAKGMRLPLGAGRYPAQILIAEGTDQEGQPLKGIYDFGFWVRDLDLAVRRLNEAGVHSDGTPSLHFGHRTAVIPPSQPSAQFNTGIRIRLVQAPPNFEFPEEGRSGHHHLDQTLGMQQLAFGALELGPLEELFVQLLGFERGERVELPTENVIELITSVGEGYRRVEVDLMMPHDAEKKPAVHKVPMNHFGLWVRDLHNLEAYLKSKGVTMDSKGIRRGAAGHDVTFILPGKVGDAFQTGVLVELVQAPPELIAEIDRLAA